jgi:hypothetical protein
VENGKNFVNYETFLRRKYLYKYAFILYNNVRMIFVGVYPQEYKK